VATNIANRLNKVLGTLNSRHLAQFAHKRFVVHTPIRSGNARRSTRLQGTTIEADYPYAQRLEDNYSKQTKGKGIVEPTIEDVRQHIFQQTGIRVR
jgi:hypothetical protein